MKKYNILNGGLASFLGITFGLTTIMGITMEFAYNKVFLISRQSHERLANYIINLSDRILVENMNYKGLQL